MTTIEIVRYYLRQGSWPVPTKPESKNPAVSDWVRFQVSEQDIPRYWNNGQGVGLVLGLSGLL
ncbi:MAG: hypothetical protein RMJ88_16845, partial [Thermogemmata sp.]|nr:hypothetical protein [Thermogemmata sp.]